MQVEIQPIAIIGMACRFPQIDNIAELWQVLCAGKNTASSVPADRWDAERYFGASDQSKGKAYVKRGNFIRQDVTTFDASFFGIAPREAENMDPQQRLLLEVVWEAFENAGIQISDYAQQNVGVYVGGFMLDHMVTQMSVANRTQINQNVAAGMMMTMLSNRISHTFDFRGPSLSIDTACSSSLVAFHYGCQDIWRGDCDTAVVGGANIMMRPEYPIGMSKGSFLSRDGESKSFDARGDGYGRGEGAGVVLLKPLAKAIEDGDMILSTVIATGTNQDGHTPGISMPNGDSQKALIRRVCKEYGVSPRQIDYVECHGTGTAIGDPTECRAIGETYGAERQGSNPVVVGSIKSNIGHLEAAAGVAGVIKAVLTTMHRKAPRLGNLQTPREDIPFEELGIQLSDRMVELGQGDDPLHVAVNSFGYGGSNAHAVLESAPVVPSNHTEATSQTDTQSVASIESNYHLVDALSTNGVSKRTETRDGAEFPFAIPVTARSNAALRDNAHRLADLLDQSDTRIDDVVYSAAYHREHLSHRAVIMGRTRAELIERLRSMTTETDEEWSVQDTQPFQGRREPAFVFTGMGPQWWRMGQELFKSSQTYRETVEEADALFRAISGFSILGEMLRDESDSQIQKTVLAQPANFLLQAGIFAVLRQYGVKPGAVVGHSVGELGSAYAAGVLSLEDALKVSFHRSQLQAETAGSGGMLAVGLGKQDALERIAECPNMLSLAAVNGESAVTLAGYVPSLQRLGDQLTREGIFSRMLDVDIPYHSPMMDPLMPRLAAALSDVATHSPNIPLYSTVTGARVTEPSFGAEYWPLNIRQPVEFEDAVHAMLDDGYTTFVEIGPHPVLSTSLRSCFNAAGKDCRLIHTLHRKLPEERLWVQRAALSVFATGCDIDWRKHTDSATFVPLPNYSWQRERLWTENDRTTQERINPIVNPILGTQDAMCAPVWRNDFDHARVHYLRDHVVKGMQVLPAAGYLESLFELIKVQEPDSQGTSLRDVQILSPMIISEDRGLDFTTTFDAETSQATIRSLENGQLGTGTVHLRASCVSVDPPKQVNFDVESMRSEVHETVDVSQFYSDLLKAGLGYEPLFQTVKEISLAREHGKAMARVALDESLFVDSHKYVLHPTLLDGCFQTLIALLDSDDATYLPTHVDEICVYVQQTPKSLLCFGERVSQTSNSVTCDMTLLDDDGHLVGVVRGLRATAAVRGERTDKYGDRVKRQVLNYRWDVGTTLEEPRRLGHWLTVGEAGDISQFVTSRLDSFGARVVSQATYGEEFQQHDSDFVIRHTEVTDARAVLESAGQLDGVVIFNAIDEAVRQSPGAEDAIASLLTFTQALEHIPLDQRPRVYVVTESAFLIDQHDRDADPISAAVNGFVRVAANELEGFKFTSVDLPVRSDIADDELEALVLELVCDADEDEVAIRGDARMTSELLETDELTNDIIEPQFLDDDHPVLLRPLRADTESTGTVRVIQSPSMHVGENDLRIRIEHSLLPPELLRDQSSSDIEQPSVEIVGTVVAAGDNVNDFALGTRVCGFAPSDLASHMTADRDKLHIVPISETTDGAMLVDGIMLECRAICSLGAVDLQTQQNAIVQISELGLAIADELDKRGVKVTLLGQDSSNAPYMTYNADPESIEDAIQNQTAGHRFDIVVCDAASFGKSYGFRALREGGTIIDTQLNPTASTLPAHASQIVRTSLTSLLQNPVRLKATLAEATGRMTQQPRTDSPALQVSVVDLAWQQLQLNDLNSRVIVSFDTNGKDLPVVRKDQVEFHSDATYLVTGGFGGFGFKTACWLADNGVRHLVLTGRSGADSPEKIAQVSKLESMGVSVEPVACDTSDIEQLTSLFEKIAADMPPLKGVFHSGAVIQDQAIADADLDTVGLVMRSKALGAWNLHLLTRELPLDHFVLYSSLANLIGNSRQSAYSAANGFLNGLARMRQRAGLPATTANWGAISDVGVVAQDEKLEQFLRHIGLRGIPSSEALDLLFDCLSRDVTQFGVLILRSWSDWARFETIGARSPRFRTLITADSEGSGSGMRAELATELAALSATDQSVLMADLVKQIVGSVLKSEPDSISIDRPVSELGIDSLMAAEIQVQFESRLGLAISVLELIGDTNIRSLAAKMLDSINDEIISAKATNANVKQESATPRQQVAVDAK